MHEWLNAAFETAVELSRYNRLQVWASSLRQSTSRSAYMSLEGSKPALLLFIHDQRMC